MTDRWEVCQGEALSTLAGLPAESVDAVVTDPPYSSGGAFRSDRVAAPETKYLTSGSAGHAGAYGTFSGDSRDQRAFRYWEALWLSEALRVARPGAPVAVFTDWRQLPTTVDAVQAGGWIWRGIAVWAKTVARPVRGGFRAQAEYIVWGTKGPSRKDSEEFLPGVITVAPVASAVRRHATEKPLEVMAVCVRLAPPGGVVLDPFAGSGSTGVAALSQGRRFLGVELSEQYAAVARERLAQAAQEGAA